MVEMGKIHCLCKCIHTIYIQGDNRVKQNYIAKSRKFLCMIGVHVESTLCFCASLISFVFANPVGVKQLPILKIW